MYQDLLVYEIPFERADTFREYKPCAKFISYSLCPYGLILFCKIYSHHMQNDRRQYSLSEI